MPLLSPATRILTIPGLDNSGPTHWQSLWEQKFTHCHRADLGQWGAPDLNQWVRRLDSIFADIDQPVLVAAHSLGCHAFTHWFEQASWTDRAKIGGALLVAPPDLGRISKLSRVTGFSHHASFVSQTPMIVVGSDNDHYAKTAYVWRLSRHWDARFVNAGPFGHINAESDIGDWHYGQYLLASLQTSVNAVISGERPWSPADPRPHREHRFGYQESIHRP